MKTTSSSRKTLELHHFFSVVPGITKPIRESIQGLDMRADNLLESVSRIGPCLKQIDNVHPSHACPIDLISGVKSLFRFNLILALAIIAI
jgi:hypothetical protein